MNKFSRRINVRGIIYNQGQLLAVRHKSSDGTTAAYYAVPGGGLDPGESLTEGLKRELMEETGIEAQIGRLLFIQQFKSERSGHNEELEFFYQVKNPLDFEQIDLSKTTHGGVELSVCEFIDPKKVLIMPSFLQSIDIGHYCHQTVEPYLYVEL